MGHTTDFVGHIDIAPPLNVAEVRYLGAFSASRRCERPGGPYDVPVDPRAETSEGFPGGAYNRPPERQPGLWCDWVPCGEGCCLAFNGNEKFYQPVAWMRYLIDHFLKPGARASRSVDRRFDEFTFDHVLSGVVVGCRRDNRELFSIVVANNRVREKVLRPADPSFVDLPPLPCEESIDREREWLSSARRRRGGDAVVVPFPRPTSTGPQAS